MLHPIGAAPDNLPGRPSDATIVGSALCANQKAAQYVLLTVPSDLSFACVFVYITEFTLLALRHEEAPEVIIQPKYFRLESMLLITGRSIALSLAGRGYAP